MKEIYEWVPWFKELSQKIADGGERYLAEKARKVKWKDDGTESALLKHGDENIDPFSFFYTLASQNTSNSRKRIYPSITSEFDLFDLSQKVDLDWEDGFIIPKPPSINPLFHKHGDGNPQLLWRIFRSAVSGFDAVDGDDFENALKIPNVATKKLTQALFLINPHEFLPIDDLNRSLGIFGAGSGSISWEEYRQCIDQVKDVFRGCQMYEVDIVSWLHNSGNLRIRLDRNFQVSTRVYDTDEEYWDDFCENNHVYTGGDGNKRNYPLTDPKPGDIVLVRCGQEGRGIGVVYKNDYQSEYKDTDRLHVLWLNKQSVKLQGGTPHIGFSRADGTVNAFRQTEAYVPTIKWLDRLGSGEEENTPNEEETPFPQEATPKIDIPKNLILYGPPGTGKTWHTVNRALEILAPDFYEDHKSNRTELKQRFNELQKEKRIGFVTFHQSFSYEDFVEGLRASAKEGQIHYEIEDGLFKRMCTNEGKQPDEPRVLIIDEINRGNIANILGELITLIEPSKRAGAEDEITVTLPYSKKPFSVPANLHIIGTMNTADRSLAHLDTALRRRFEFEAVFPDAELLQDIEIDGINIQKMLMTINSRIKLLCDRDHTLGHSFFLPLKEKPDLGTLKRIFENRIMPLLEEYFFEDWSRIRKVLGDDRKAGKEELMFYVPTFSEGEISKLLGRDNENNQELSDKVFRRNEEALSKPEAWIGVYEEEEPEQETAGQDE